MRLFMTAKRRKGNRLLTDERENQKFEKLDFQLKWFPLDPHLFFPIALFFLSPSFPCSLIRFLSLSPRTAHPGSKRVLYLQHDNRLSFSSLV